MKFSSPEQPQRQLSAHSSLFPPLQSPLVLSAIGSDGPMIVNATALATVVSVYNTAATTQPTPSSATTVPRVNLTLNTFGGIIRWNAAPTQQFTMIGSAVNLGILVLYNSSTGNGVTTTANAHIIYEPY